MPDKAIDKAAAAQWRRCVPLHEISDPLLDASHIAVRLKKRG